MPQADTAVAVFHEHIVPTLGRRQMFVLYHLCDYLRVKCEAPTALELLRRVRLLNGSSYDVNSIRPRLTELLDKGAVVVEGKRRCTVSGKYVRTWKPAPAQGQLF